MIGDKKRNEIIQQLAANSAAKSRIDPALYEKYSVKRGLRNEDGTGVLVGLTEVGEVFSYIMDDADRVPVEGRLFYRGMGVADIVNGFYQDKRFGFEETVYLLLFGELPTQEQLDQFEDLIRANRNLPVGFTEDMILKAPSPDIMNKLARTVLALYAYDPMADDISIENVLRQSIELIARFPVLISYAYMAKRHYVDNESLFLHSPQPHYNTAQNILHMIRPDGQFTDLEARILDLALVLHAEHGGGNNSTFVTKAVTSSGSDTYSVIAAAIGSLKGPQHGGASGKAYDMMQDLKNNVKNWRNEMEIAEYLTKILKKEAYDKSGLIYGIGHAVYTLSDPRTKLLRDYARALAYEAGKEEEYELYTLTERMAPEVFRNVKKNDKIVCANVDFYSGFIYNMLGIPPELYTPIFAVARIAGWSAHRIEELVSGGRIMRPAYKCVQKRRKYVGMSDRGYGDNK
ncbi:MAG: citrate/2-methylcitrate synthase [Eubacteriales bacterium]|jgi:citrate synthase|nr:citrate/2-methylcitrate synthase [Eubacteriales bacterium]MDD3502529.1 citrate/2-methylcitrate synthase [Eubacteriales bacterium]